MQYLVVFDVYMKDHPAMGSTTNTMLVKANSFEGAKINIKQWYAKNIPIMEPKNFTNKTI